MAEMDPREARQIAGVELNALSLAGVLPLDLFAGGEVSAEATPIHDISGEVLFFRLPVVRRTQQIATVDIAAHEVLGDPLVAVSVGMPWNPEALLGEARQVAGKNRRLKVGEADEMRFVAYSYPKIAVQFLRGGEELAMLELFTWSVVPPAETKDRRPLQPESFERWSLVTEMPARARRNPRCRLCGASRPPQTAQHQLGGLQDRPQQMARRLQDQPRRYPPDRILTASRRSHPVLRTAGPGDKRVVRGRQCPDAAGLLPLRVHPNATGAGTGSRHQSQPQRAALQSGWPRGHRALEALTGNGLNVTMLTNPNICQVPHRYTGEPAADQLRPGSLPDRRRIHGELDRADLLPAVPRAPGLRPVAAERRRHHQVGELRHPDLPVRIHGVGDQDIGMADSEQVRSSARAFTDAPALLGVPLPIRDSAGRLSSWFVPMVADDRLGGIRRDAPRSHPPSYLVVPPPSRFARGVPSIGVVARCQHRSGARPTRDALG